MIEDITQRKLAEEQLREYAEASEYQALHDALTGLPNRVLFHDRIEQALLQAERDGGRLAILLMDFDRFKEINDTLGHASGDHVLREVGSRLNDCLRASDTVARLGGDEFGILLPKQTQTSEITRILDKLTAAIEVPIDVEGLPLGIECSIGVAFFPDHGRDVQELVKRADIAMYQAKQENRPYAFFDGTSEDNDPARLTLVGELRLAIDRRELKLVYQPKATLSDGNVRSVEALLRWYHPERGLLPPNDFIPQAQETGLMKPLTLYVLDEALAQVRAWQGEGLDLAVSVNLATRNLIDVGFPDDVAAALAKWDVHASRLELEITESTMLQDPARTKTVLDKLHAMGIRLSIDDFGTGYSSLAYLRQLPVSEIKIDRSFVTNMHVDDADDVIVRMTIDLGRNLGLEVVAEGVETEDAWQRLTQLGCDVAQGFFLSRPVPADELGAWLRQRRSHHAQELHLERA
jgi:diguanylate cyclase (GGDEF)-like protein